MNRKLSPRGRRPLRKKRPQLYNDPGLSGSTLISNSLSFHTPQQYSKTATTGTITPENPFLGLPTEIHFRIFKFACLDDGRSGCALSAVCKLVRANSEEFRYSSIALYGEMQIMAFRDTLVMAMTHMPANRRAIRNLFVYGRPMENFQRMKQILRNMCRSHAASGTF